MLGIPVGVCVGAKVGVCDGVWVGKKVGGADEVVEEGAGDKIDGGGHGKIFFFTDFLPFCLPFVLIMRINILDFILIFIPFF
jgi:hypothetical protein